MKRIHVWFKGFEKFLWNFKCEKKQSVLITKKTVHNAKLHKQRIFRVQLFEQYSRGYTGIDFSSTPAGAKKILITGFESVETDEIGLKRIQN